VLFCSAAGSANRSPDHSFFRSLTAFPDVRALCYSWDDICSTDGSIDGLVDHTRDRSLLPLVDGFPTVRVPYCSARQISPDCSFNAPPTVPRQPQAGDPEEEGGDAGSEASEWELRERRERQEERKGEAEALGVADDMGDGEGLSLFLPTPSFMASASEE